MNYIMNIVFKVSDNVKIPSELNWSNPTWSSSNTNIATVDQDRLVATLKSGNVNIIELFKRIE